MVLQSACLGYTKTSASLKMKLSPTLLIKSRCLQFFEWLKSISDCPNKAHYMIVPSWCIVTEAVRLKLNMDSAPPPPPLMPSNWDKTQYSECTPSNT